MNYQRNGLGVAITAVLALAGCGTALEQDKGVGTSTAFHARIVDGYLAGSLVFVDSNDNGVLDAWEERAFTDRDGFVSASASGKDYCAAGAPATDAVHCLKVRPADALKIRASGGYDMSTGEPFNGALSLDTTRASGSDSTKPVIASPLTTLLAGLDAVDKQTVITKFGLSSAGVSAGLFDADFMSLSSGNTTEDQRKLLTAAMQVQKSVEVISSFLTKVYDGTDRGYSGLGKNAALPRDASEFVYAAYADLLASKTKSLDVNGLASAPDGIKTIIDGANDRIKARIADVTKKAIAEIVGDPTMLASLDGRKGNISNLGSSTAVLFVGGTNSPAVTALDNKQVAARLRAINIAVAVARDTDVAKVPGSRVDDALNAATGDSAYLTSLEKEVDLARLAQKFKDGDVAGAKGAASATRVTVDSALKISADKDSTTKLDLNDPGKGNLAMAFTTTSFETVDNVTKATGGTLAMDVKDFSGGGDLFKKTDGAPTSVPGTWEKLNDYSLLVTIEPIPGVKQQAVVKPTLDADGVTTKYFFDYGGKQYEWKGAVP